MKTIRRGDTNQTVRVLQYFLGVMPDGIFGSDTEKKLRELQAKLKLPVDGVCGPTSWAAIAAVQPVVYLGKTGNAVKALQAVIGIPVSSAGLFGALTDGTVRKVQAAAGLKADGKVGPITWAYLLTQYAMPEPKPVQPVDYKQYDKRWAKTIYSSHGDTRQTIQNNGCGPTVLADILATWRDTQITPVETAKMAVKNGYCTYSNGTARAFFDWAAKEYDFSNYSRTYSTDDAISALKAGAYVVALMGPGYWTGGGHYILCWRYEVATDRIYANDPASATRKSAISSIFRRQRKEYFIYFK